MANVPPVPKSELVHNVKIGLAVLGFLCVIGAIIYGISKFLKKAGIKPYSKKLGEQCGTNIECETNKCKFAVCV